jgi:hypothetical protein
MIRIHGQSPPPRRAWARPDRERGMLVPRGEIGFVCTTPPRPPNPAPVWKLALFCTIGPRPIGFVCTTRPGRPEAAGRRGGLGASLFPIRNPQSEDWVRFAQFGGELGLFCTIGPAEFGLFVQPARWDRACGQPIGFASQNCLPPRAGPQILQPAQAWLCCRNDTGQRGVVARIFTTETRRPPRMKSRACL